MSDNVPIKPLIKEILCSVDIKKANALIYNRYKKHIDFINDRIQDKKEVKHENEKMQCKVMTSQETEMTLHYLEDNKLLDDKEKLVFETSYMLNRDIWDFPIAEKGSLFFSE